MNLRSLIANKDIVASAFDGPPSALMAFGLSKSYDRRLALDRVSIRLEPGQVLGLIGRNGAGKTSLIRCLLGLCKPNGGAAWVLGQPAFELSDKEKMQLGYVAQQPDAMDWMSVREMLAFVAQFYPQWDHDYVHQQRERLGIRWDMQMARLTPGERQSIAILRALAPQPSLLVLDEPAAALDPIGRRALLREIANRAAETQCTVLFSTHIVSDLERVASHVAFMHEGRILLHEELDALKERHQRLHVPSELTARFSERLPGEIARHQREDGSLRIFAIADESEAWATMLGMPEIRREQLSLEDLFVELSE